MDDKEVLAGIVQLLGESTRNVESWSSDLATLTLTADLGLNSADLIDLVLDVEQTYGISISDNDIASLSTLGDLVSLVTHAKNPGV